MEFTIPITGRALKIPYVSPPIMQDQRGSSSGLSPSSAVSSSVVSSVVSSSVVAAGELVAYIDDVLVEEGETYDLGNHASGIGTVTYHSFRLKNESAAPILVFDRLNLGTGEVSLTGTHFPIPALPETLDPGEEWVSELAVISLSAAGLQTHELVFTEDVLDTPLFNFFVQVTFV